MRGIFMKYVTILISLVFLFGFLAISQETSTEGATSGIMAKGVPERTITSPNASVPNKISYQGILTSSGGAPVADGAYDIKFELFNVASGGTALWSETQTAVPVSNGTFSVLLGSVTPLIGIFYQPLWVEITVVSGPGIGSPIVFSPRTELASAAYALGPFLKSGDNYYLNSGQLGIGGEPQENFLLDTRGNFSFIRSKATSGWAGFVADKTYPTDNNYFILRTAGVDKWVLGTMGNDNFQIRYWPLFQPYVYVDTLGKVGIGTTTPDKLLTVSGNAKVRDTLFVGTTTSSGQLNMYRSGVSLPVAKANSSVYGGQLQLFDELGNLVVDLRPNGYGEGGGVDFYRSPSERGVEIWGNAYGQGQGYIGVRGDNRSMIFDPRLVGNNSVQLPDSSISAAEMFNEPGVANSYVQGPITIANTGVTNILSTTINVPAAGYIVAQAHSYGYLSGDTLGNLIVSIETSPSLNSSLRGSAFGFANEVFGMSVLTWGQLSPHKVFYVNSAGTYTYYLTGARGYNRGAAGIYAAELLLTYFPTSYGTVQASIPASMVSEFDSPELINSGLSENSPSQNENNEELYKVDLRELEIKALKARAEAERAERELLEAQQKIQQPSGSEPH